MPRRPHARAPFQICSAARRLCADRRGASGIVVLFLVSLLAFAGVFLFTQTDMLNRLLNPGQQQTVARPVQQTMVPDLVADPIQPFFEDIRDAGFNLLYDTTFTPTGFNEPVFLNVNILAGRPEVAISTDGGMSFQPPPVQIEPGQTVTVRVRTSNEAVTDHTMEVQLGATRATYTITTGLKFDLDITGRAYNINVARELGYPGTARQYVVRVNQNAIIGGATVGYTRDPQPAFTTGELPAGSTLLLLNYGRIQGVGGFGGRGGNASSACHPTSANGAPGGDAIHLTVDAAIDNSRGFIFGGGGGGGGACNTVCFPMGRGAGGGGGAGAGTSPAQGGCADALNCGSPGNFDAGGGPRSGCGGVIGGAGGAPGEDGRPGTGTQGGRGGLALQLNGNRVNFLGGEDPGRLRGGIR